MYSHFGRPVKNAELQDDKTVSKFVQSISYKTLYEAAKVEHVYVVHVVNGYRVEVATTKIFELVSMYSLKLARASEASSLLRVIQMLPLVLLVPSI